MHLFARIAGTSVKRWSANSVVVHRDRGGFNWRRTSQMQPRSRDTVVLLWLFAEKRFQRNAIPCQLFRARPRPMKFQQELGLIDLDELLRARGEAVNESIDDILVQGPRGDAIAAFHEIENGPDNQVAGCGIFYRAEARQSIAGANEISHW
jgi:hypothetical protein